MERKLTRLMSPMLCLTVLSIFSFAADSRIHHRKSGKAAQTLSDYVEQASELSSRARANVYFENPQSIFRGVQVNFVNVGKGNLTFLRRDMVASGRIPLVFARAYDSNSKGSVDFGPGWILSAAESITLIEGKAHLLSENGSIIDFVKASDNGFQLEKDYPSDYLSLRVIDQSTLEAKLRTGFTKRFSLIGGIFRLVGVTDRNGNSVMLNYMNGLLNRITNANHSLTITRNQKGRIISVQDDAHRKVQFSYDDAGQLIEADDLGGKAWTYNYTSPGRLKEARDPLQRLNFAIAYDEKGRVHHLQLPSGNMQFYFDPAARITTVVDRKNLISHFFQNEEGITVRVTNPLAEETALNLDEHRNANSIIRNGTSLEIMRYDEHHRLLTRQTPTDQGTADRQYEYDPAFGLVSKVYLNGKEEASFDYDAKGNPRSARLADHNYSFKYSSLGDLISFTAQDRTIAFTPDRDGLIASATEDGTTATMAYNAGGELAEAIFPDRTHARYEYRSSGLRAKLTYKDGRRVDYEYDPAGNLTETRVFDARGKQVNGQRLQLNDSYQLIHWTLFDGTDKLLKYDSNGNLTEIKEAKSTTRFEYDELDRLIAVVTPNGDRLTYSYRPGERSIIEQYEHSSILTADLRDTGFTFANLLDAVASRPVAAVFGFVRFSEHLGTFQLSGADGSEILMPHQKIEGALSRLRLFVPDLSRRALRSGFNAPFNTMFMPAEYATINCCPDCYYDGEEWYCPPCEPPDLSGIPDHLIVVADVSQSLNCTGHPVQRQITYEVVDINDSQVVQQIFARESLGTITYNNCNSVVNFNPTCTGFPPSVFTQDTLNIACGDTNCSIHVTDQQLFVCDPLGDIHVGSHAVLDLSPALISVDGNVLGFLPGTPVFP